MSEKEKHELDRRSFLKGAAAAGALVAAAGATACAPAPVEENNQQAAPNDDGAMTAERAAQKWSFEIPPDPVDESEITATHQADIIIIGSGCAGFECAAAACEVGGDVILFSAGTQGVSRGGSNHGMGTKVQERYGIDYTPASAAAFIKGQLTQHDYMPDMQKWHKWMENSAESMNWLIDIMEGEGYEVTLEVGFEDPEGIWTCQPAAHNFISGPGDFGAALGQAHVMETLEKKILEWGGQIHYSTRAMYLERENNNTGRVTAVIAEGPDGSYIRYIGNKGIIMATGDFSQNKEMMAKYSPWYMDLLFPDVEINYDANFQFGGLFPGDGQKMGLWIGAAWQKMLPNAPQINCIGPAPWTHSMANHTGINLNRNGERFFNEDTLVSYAGLAFYHQPGKEVYFIWDTDYANWFPEWEGFGCTIPQDNGPKPTTPEQQLEQWEGSVEQGAFVKGDTIEETLSQLEGLNVENAVATVERYNTYVENGYDAEFHKHKTYLAPIKTPPFYAVKKVIDPSNFLCVCGGLRTNVEMQVCDADDQPIEGLYNIGVMVGDMFGYDYNFAIPGHGLGALCNTFPYLLGRELAQA
jgi:hypothetical protein